MQYLVSINHAWRVGPVIAVSSSNECDRGLTPATDSMSSTVPTISIRLLRHVLKSGIGSQDLVFKVEVNEKRRLTTVGSLVELNKLKGREDNLVPDTQRTTLNLRVREHTHTYTHGVAVALKWPHPFSDWLLETLTLRLTGYCLRPTGWTRRSLANAVPRLFSRCYLRGAPLPHFTITSSLAANIYQALVDDGAFVQRPRWAAECQRAAVTEWSDCSIPKTKKRTGFKSPAGLLRIFAIGSRARRCRWWAGFFGDLPFSQPLRSSDAPFSPHFAFIGSQDLAAKSRLNLSTQHVIEATRAYWEYEKRPAIIGEKSGELEITTNSSERSDSSISILEFFEGPASSVFPVAGSSGINCPSASSCAADTPGNPVFERALEIDSDSDLEFFTLRILPSAWPTRAEQGGGNVGSPSKPRRPVTLSSIIPTSGNPGVASPGMNLVRIVTVLHAALEVVVSEPEARAFICGRAQQPHAKHVIPQCCLSEVCLRKCVVTVLHAALAVVSEPKARAFICGRAQQPHAKHVIHAAVCQSTSSGERALGTSIHMWARSAATFETRNTRCCLSEVCLRKCVVTVLHAALEVVVSEPEARAFICGRAQQPHAKHVIPQCCLSEVCLRKCVVTVLHAALAAVSEPEARAFICGRAQQPHAKHCVVTVLHAALEVVVSEPEARAFICGRAQQPHAKHVIHGAVCQSTSSGERALGTSIHMWERSAATCETRNTRCCLSEVCLRKCVVTVLHAALEVVVSEPEARAFICGRAQQPHAKHVIHGAVCQSTRSGGERARGTSIHMWARSAATFETRNTRCCLSEVCLRKCVVTVLHAALEVVVSEPEARAFICGRAQQPHAKHVIHGAVCQSTSSGERALGTSIHMWERSAATYETRNTSVLFVRGMFEKVCSYRVTCSTRSGGERARGTSIHMWARSAATCETRNTRCCLSEVCLRKCVVTVLHAALAVVVSETEARAFICGRAQQPHAKHVIPQCCLSEVCLRKCVVTVLHAALAVVSEP
ncbi:hypothetical protein PR048_032979 [Dryococelus australis]|uniref:Uncharacterized protein n=1 Tax=Dryococelus australis TaxID=614101 RepID=A0ABQ9G6K6_9NEOP|nr:hypothetical protein PR048_032979 [Dryococelus australis]